VVAAAQLCTMNLGAILAMMLTSAAANMYDVLLPHYEPADGCICAPWDSVGNATEQSRIDATWLEGKPPADANNSCAMPAASAGLFECDGCTVDKIYNSFKGPWCYCIPLWPGFPANEQYCTPPVGIPEQINLQLAAPDVTVASFVTFDFRVPNSTELPEALFGDSPETLTSVIGISHPYRKLSVAENTNYTFHFIKFDQLEPRKKYWYKVRSGMPGAVWSELFSFRAPYASGETRLGSYGDMGHSHYNNMGNLGDDCAAGRIDAVLHMGDHAYDMGNGGDRRGDAYMNAYQRTLAGCSWIPVIGNHEANDGDGSYRYLNMTFGVTLGDSNGATFDGFVESGVTSTATSALGDLLTKSTLLGAARHSGLPSHTSRYFSVNIGLIHIAAVDLNGGTLGDAQSAWLEADLAAVNRSETPWVFGTSHFPLYNDAIAANMDASAAYYTGEKPEFWPTSGHEFQPAKCSSKANEQVCEQTVGELMQSIQSELMPILHKYSVDIWNAGHIHDYQSTWPVCFSEETGTTAICRDREGNLIKDFKDWGRSQGLVHVTEGNGGVPGVVGQSTLKNCTSTSNEWCRTHGTGGAYGRWIATASTLTYEHVQNNGGAVTDTFTITQ